MFSNKTLAFLRALKKNNDRAWFHERRAEYEAHVRGPMVAIVERLGQDFGAFAPDLVVDPKRSLFRPWRDTRFSENRVIHAPAFKMLGGLKGATLTRAPRGWPKDHPAAHDLIHKQFLGFREEPAAFATRPDFYGQLLASLKALTPLVTFLNEPLLDRVKPEKRVHIRLV